MGIRVARRRKIQNHKPGPSLHELWLRGRRRLRFRFGFGFLHAFGHDVRFADAGRLAMQFDFISRQLARVFDAQFIGSRRVPSVRKSERLDKGDFILVRLEVHELHLVRSHLAFADRLFGELAVLKLELERISLLANSGSKLRFPFPDKGFICAPGGNGQRQQQRSQRDCFEGMFHKAFLGSVVELDRR